MTEERKKVSPEQLEILINELEKDQSLINGPRTSAQGRTNYNAKWEELAEKLNSVEGGALKNFTKWQQVRLNFHSVSLQTLPCATTYFLF